MTRLHSLKPGNKLPTVKQTGLPPSIKREANQAVQGVLECESKSKSTKRKYTPKFTFEVFTAIA